MHCRIPESVIHIECLDLVSGEYLDLLHYSLAGPIRKNPWAIFLDPLKTHTTIIIFKNRIHSHRSEEHTSELHSQMRIAYAVFCLKTKKHNTTERQVSTLQIDYQ